MVNVECLQARLVPVITYVRASTNSFFFLFTKKAVFHITEKLQSSPPWKHEEETMLENTEPPSIYPFSYTGSWGAWSLSKGVQGTRPGTLWKGCQHNCTHNRTLRTNLEMTIGLSLDYGRKSEYLGKPRSTGRTSRLRAYRMGQESNPQLRRGKANMLTTKPLCPPSKKC